MGKISVVKPATAKEMVKVQGYQEIGQVDRDGKAYIAVEAPGQQ